MKKLSILLLALLSLTACHKSLEDKAAEEAAEYTRKNCPTPFINDTRTDSVTFTKANRTYHYYCTFAGKFDDARIIDLSKDKLRVTMIESIRNNANLKKSKEEGFNFEYVVRSQKDPKQILYQQLITRKDYK